MAYRLDQLPADIRKDDEGNEHNITLRELKTYLPGAQVQRKDAPYNVTPGSPRNAQWLLARVKEGKALGLNYSDWLTKSPDGIQGQINQAKIRGTDAQKTIHGSQFEPKAVGATKLTTANIQSPTAPTFDPKKVTTVPKKVTPTPDPDKAKTNKTASKMAASLLNQGPLNEPPVGLGLTPNPNIYGSPVQYAKAPSPQQAKSSTTGGLRGTIDGKVYHNFGEDRGYRTLGHTYGSGDIRGGPDVAYLPPGSEDDLLASPWGGRTIGPYGQIPRATFPGTTPSQFDLPERIGPVRIIGPGDQVPRIGSGFSFLPQEWYDAEGDITHADDVEGLLRNRQRIAQEPQLQRNIEAMQAAQQFLGDEAVLGSSVPMTNTRLALSSGGGGPAIDEDPSLTWMPRQYQMEDIAVDPSLRTDVSPSGFQRSVPRPQQSPSLRVPGVDEAAQATDINPITGEAANAVVAAQQRAAVAAQQQRAAEAAVVESDNDLDTAKELEAQVTEIVRKQTETNKKVTEAAKPPTTPTTTKTPTTTTPTVAVDPSVPTPLGATGSYGDILAQGDAAGASILEAMRGSGIYAGNPFEAAIRNRLASLQAPFQLENMIRTGMNKLPVDFGPFLSQRLETGDMSSPVSQANLAALSGEKGRLNPAQAMLAGIIESEPSKLAFPLAMGGSPYAGGPRIFRDAALKQEANLRNQYNLDIGRERREDTDAADYLSFLRQQLGGGGPYG